MNEFLTASCSRFTEFRKYWILPFSKEKVAEDDFSWIYKELKRLNLAQIIDRFVLKRYQKKRNEQVYGYLKSDFQIYFV